MRAEKPYESGSAENHRTRRRNRQLTACEVENFGVEGVEEGSGVAIRSSADFLRRSTEKDDRFSGTGFGDKTLQGI